MKYGGLAAVLLFFSFGVDGTSAQTPASPPAAPLLTVPHTDFNFGFELQLPAGWIYDRNRFGGPQGAVGLLNGQSPDNRQALQILVFSIPTTQSFEDWMKQFEKRIKGLEGVKKVAPRAASVPQRQAAMLEVEARAGKTPIRTHYFCVAFDANTVWMLMLSGQVADASAADPLRTAFEQLAGSLRVLYEPREAEARAAAVERGQALAARIQADANGIKPEPAPRYYEIAIEGRPVGYLTRQVGREEQSFSERRNRNRHVKDGVRVRDRSLRFSDDGTARYEQIDCFASLDGQSELIASQLTQIPPPAASKQTPFTAKDECVREADVLASSYLTTFDRALPPPRKPLRAGSNYLSLAWLPLLPRWLGTAAAEPYAFTIYDSEAGVLKTHLIQPLGRRPLPGQNGTEAYAYEMREGFAPERNMLYADAEGHLLRYEAGKMTMTPATAAEIERKYAARREEALKRLGP